MGRVWNGSAGFDEILVAAAGALSGLDGGPITIACIWVPEQTQFGSIVQARNGSAATVWELLLDTDGKYYIAGDFGGGDSYPVGVWQCAGYTKADGSATYRSHLYRYDTDAFAHTNRSTVGDGTGPVTEIRIGGGSGRLDGTVAVLGVFDYVLTDAQFELLPFSLQSWLSLAPKALWLFDQADTGTKVLDVTGGGANESSIIGSSPGVSTLSTPVFSYGFDPLLATHAPAGGQASSGAGAATVHANTAATAVKQAAAAAAAPQRATTTDTAVKGSAAATTGAQRTSVVATGLKQATGVGAATQHTADTAAGLKQATGTGAAIAHPTTRAATAPSGPGNALAHSATTAAGKAATAGAARSSPRTATTAAGKAGGLATTAATIHTATQATGGKAAAAATTATQRTSVVAATGLVPPPTAANPVLYTAAVAILTCVRVALAATAAGAPARSCVVPGALAWDACDCGLLAVSITRVYPSRTFPIDAGGDSYATSCPLPYLAADLSVTVLRCAPSPDRAGNPPSCGQLAAASATWRADAAAVRAALACCLPGLRDSAGVEEVALADLVPLGPEGGCVGLEQHLTLGLCAAVPCG